MSRSNGLDDLRSLKRPTTPTTPTTPTSPTSPNNSQGDPPPDSASFPEVSIEAAEEHEGWRLDRFISQALDVPRNQVQKWINEGLLAAKHRKLKASSPIHTGEVFSVRRPPKAASDARCDPEEGELSVLEENPDFIVLDKPPALAVHPGAGRERGTLANRLIYRYPELAGVGGAGRPGIVHRLDLDTSGVMVIARTPESYDVLQKAFAERRVDKNYWAIVWGIPKQTEGKIDLPIGRHPTKRKEMTIRLDGRPSQSSYRVLATSTSGLAFVEVDLHTGRTHQIRVHLKALGHPIVGDPVYGEARWRALPSVKRGSLARFARPALHAARLAFADPATGEHREYRASLPADMTALWAFLNPDSHPVPTV